MHSRLALPSALLALALATAPTSYAAGEPALDSMVESAAALRQDGHVARAIAVLERALQRATPAQAPWVAAELGVAYFQAHRLQEAQAKLQFAYDHSTDTAQRARVANDLGNLHASRGASGLAQRMFVEARATPGAEAAVKVSAGLNLARLAHTDERLAQLLRLHSEIEALADVRQRVRSWLNLGTQARTLEPAALRLSFQSLDRARALADQTGERILLAESLDELAQLYEDQARPLDALKLSERAILALPAQQGSDLAIQLHWRRARLLRAQGDTEQALAAYRSAVENIEAIRQDIPVEYVDGLSSFRTTLEPIYLGLADLLLRKAANAKDASRVELLRSARDTVELIKQTELQDYLGERCTIESASLSATTPPAGTAVLYPVMLEDRLELLIETSAGIATHRVAIGAAALREKAHGFAKSLREGRLDSLPRAQDLYALLLRPLESELSSSKTNTVVVVPDGALRLIPLGALHDGERYVLERYSFITAPGLTITGMGTPTRQGKTLLAGVAEPGPAVEKLPQPVIDEITAEQAPPVTRGALLREKLALPSVKQEIEALHSKTRSDALLDNQFTVERFRRQLGSGDYRTVHIASHAMFNRRADMSFIMAYDDVLSMDDLQQLLRSDALPSGRIDMLTLSACQTAEGDDRAPLGLAGAVLKARAGSALGSLWPVADEATQLLMVRFYELLSSENLSKSEALQRAQLDLSQRVEFAHPYYWAPFVLVGGSL